MAQSNNLGKVIAREAFEARASLVSELRSYAESGAIKIRHELLLHRAANVIELLNVPTKTDALQSAIRAAKLAIFVINKQGIMPNSSWKSGFDRDLAIAEAALSAAQTFSEGSIPSQSTSHKAKA